MASMRVGIGYDVHRLESGRKLILGGVEIPFEKGLLGHSDADVLTHALMDAILGALGEADIGHLFPDSDPLYKDISSLTLLTEVVRRMDKAGYAIGNVDCMVIAQRPKIAPYIDPIKENYARILHCDQGAINVKATTEEHLGFTGREEGIAAQAVVLLEKV